MKRMEAVLRFMEIILGRSENVTTIEIIPHGDGSSGGADVYPSYYANRSHSSRRNRPQRFDVLVDPVRDPHGFSDILTHWIERDATWYIARSRLARVWGKTSYNEDRIVSAANAFDIIPSEIYGTNAPLSPALNEAKDRASTIFRKLLPCDEASSVLTNLGRIGSWRLKKKIRYRGRVITDRLGGFIPDIGLVTDEAVNLRNFYVHGSPPRVGANRHMQFLVFLTQSLEFVFIASDLIDMGWKIADWCRVPKPLGHPFQNYLASYSQSLEKLRLALQSR